MCIKAGPACYAYLNYEIPFRIVGCVHQQSDDPESKRESSTIAATREMFQDGFGHASFTPEQIGIRVIKAAEYGTSRRELVTVLGIIRREDQSNYPQVISTNTV
jgi:hypothetical protein